MNLDLLRLTSDPAYFPGLHWKEQREEIMALGGEVTATDIIAEKPELEEIRTAVEKHGLTDFANIVQKDLDMHIKTINEAKIRIDEASKALTGLDDIKVLEEQARERILLAQKPVDELLEERAAIVSGTAVKNITDQNSALEAKMEEIKAKHRELIAEVKKPYLEKMAILDSDVEMRPNVYDLCGSSIVSVKIVLKILIQLLKGYGSNGLKSMKKFLTRQNVRVAIVHMMLE